MRLGFHYHVPAFRDRQGKIRTPGYQGLFLDSLAARCEQVVCFLHTPRPDELEQMDYTIVGSNVDLVGIGPHASVPYRLRHAGAIMKPLGRRATDLDALLIRGPSPLLSMAAKAAGDLPVALLLVGSYVDGVKDLPQPYWRKQLIYLFGQINQLQQLRVARRALTFVNSHKLYEQLKEHVPHLLETRTTTLRSDDIFVNGMRPLHHPPRLLYAGRMDRTKGLFQMIDAVKRLEEHGHIVEMDFVGWPQKGDSIMEDLQRHAKALGIQRRIRYQGYVPAGDELLRRYRSADVFVTASLSAEGFPRTIWEAMASAVPVVATNVGSIPSYLEHQKHAMLVPPFDSAALSSAIINVIQDHDLRKRLVTNGIDLANNNTLEIRSKELVDNIGDWVQFLKPGTASGLSRSNSFSG